MTEMRPFLFEGDKLVRVEVCDAVPRFVVVDVCRICGVKNPTQAVAGLDEDERGLCSIETPGGFQDMVVVTEGGLWTIILRCRDALKPGSAPHRLRKWVTSEVLPSIRQTGGYQIGEKNEAERRGRHLPDLEDMDAEEPELTKLRIVAEARLTWNQIVAREVWLAKGLIRTPSMSKPPAQIDMFALIGPVRDGEAA